MKIEIVKETDVFLVTKYWVRVDKIYKSVFKTEEDAINEVMKLEGNINSGKVKTEVIYSKEFQDQIHGND